MYSMIEIRALFGLKRSNTRTPRVEAAMETVVQFPQNSIENQPPDVENGEDRELDRLRQLNKLQERLLDVRAQQHEEQRRERDWLKARIEKLEEKNERDQLLLLSETQMIRKLITTHEERRTPLQLALEWLGFTAPAKPKPAAT